MASLPAAEVVARLERAAGHMEDGAATLAAVAETAKEEAQWTRREGCTCGETRRPHAPNCALNKAPAKGGGVMLLDTPVSEGA